MVVGFAPEVMLSRLYYDTGIEAFAPAIRSDGQLTLGSPFIVR